ncbi:MAG: mRNA surveillance protein pelota [Candidatus Hadarchaeum sp.]|uniref:mRNA surveillance protein pelota n=1 Tax=Candidatus Hadarchaeum sp. TaxID=2883567 RepID=UPI003D0D37FA
MNLKIIHKDLKHGKIKLALETLDDLWHLQHLIRQGDIVTATTFRREQETGDKIRPERMEKIPVTLSIQVENVEFHKHSNRLRVLGKIVEGPDTGKHHSFSFELGSVLTITKEWNPEDLRRVQEAVKAAHRPRVLLVAIDDSSADLAVVRQYGLDEIGTITRPRAGKRYSVENEADEKKFFHRLAEAIKDVTSRENIKTTIVAGPGFTKDSFASFLRENFPELAKDIRLGDASYGGGAGLYEIVRRGLVEYVSKEDRLSLETSLMEQFMGEIAKEGLATYGINEVERAVDAGAVERLLVADELLRSNQENVSKILERARKTRAEVLVISTEHDAGKQLLALGGIAAFLRFKFENQNC